MTPLAPVSPLTPAQVRRAIVAPVIGNGFEWFDFLAYPYFAKTIARVFFLAGNSFVSLSRSWRRPAAWHNKPRSPAIQAVDDAPRGR
ncbi:MAG: hypothetical protein JO371_15020 [Paraburkholderia sp.]|nr:hypothetical protein [Paraburkholderia sp.]